MGQPFLEGPHRTHCFSGGIAERVTVPCKMAEITKLEGKPLRNGIKKKRKLQGREGPWLVAPLIGMSSYMLNGRSLIPGQGT